MILRIGILIIALFASTSDSLRTCTANENQAKLEDAENKVEINSLQSDSIGHFFNLLMLYRMNYAHSYNLKENYPKLKKRIIRVQDSIGANPGLTLLIRQIELLSNEYSLSNDEIKENDNKLLTHALTPNELKRIRELYKNELVVDSLQNVESNIHIVAARYKEITLNINKCFYFRDSLSPKIWSTCKKYRELRKQLDMKRSAEIVKIKKIILERIVENQENKDFLESLINPVPSDTLTPCYKNNIAPIYNRIDSQYCIYGMNYRAFGDKTLLSRSSITDSMSNQSISDIINGRHFHDYNIIQNDESNKVYAYTSTNKKLISVASFGYCTNTCTGPYFFYPLSEDRFNDDKLLFSSVFSLELDYGNFMEVDSILKRDYLNICYDCPSGQGDQKAFARLKGYENIYFVTTADSNGEIDQTPTYIRAVYYISEDISFSLWYSEFDAFGCPCL